MSKYNDYIYDTIVSASPRIAEILGNEMDRQEENCELIASENFVSDAVLAAVGSCFTNKYAEGYPTSRHSGRECRYYGGTQNVDELEEYCCKKWRDVFNTEYHVNVQPHSGSQANFAAYMSVLEPGDTILSMSLENGGHLTHGSPVNFSGKLFNMVFYDVDKNGFIDYFDLAQKIAIYNPKLVLAGASAYPRIIDFKRIKELIDGVSDKYGRTSPYFMVDMSHIAGLVAAGDHPSPFELADIITTTTHKTLRGPRGGLIFCKPELAKKVDGAVFPGSQGGPLEHVIAGKAIAAEEACTPEYKEYIHQVVRNSKAMCNKFIELGYDITTGGTDNHLFLLDFSKTHPNLTGKMVQDELDKRHITLNKNCIPNDKRSPMQASGVRIGTAAMTTKGYKEQYFIDKAVEIDNIISHL